MWINPPIKAAMIRSGKFIINMFILDSRKNARIEDTIILTTDAISRFNLKIRLRLKSEITEKINIDAVYAIAIPKAENEYVNGKDNAKNTSTVKKVIFRLIFGLPVAYKLLENNELQLAKIVPKVKSSNRLDAGKYSEEE